MSGYLVGRVTVKRGVIALRTKDLARRIAVNAVFLGGSSSGLGPQFYTLMIREFESLTTHQTPRERIISEKSDLYFCSSGRNEVYF